jgi:hypothetical protein
MPGRKKSPNVDKITLQEVIATTELLINGMAGSQELFLYRVARQVRHGWFHLGQECWMGVLRTLRGVLEKECPTDPHAALYLIGRARYSKVASRLFWHFHQFRDIFRVKTYGQYYHNNTTAFPCVCRSWDS